MEQAAAGKLATVPATPAPIHHGMKSSWPELLGKMATMAVQKIAHDRPDVAVEVLPLGSHVIPGHNALRVRVHFDVYGLSP